MSYKKYKYNNAIWSQRATGEYSTIMFDPVNPLIGTGEIVMSEKNLIHSGAKIYDDTDELIEEYKNETPRQEKNYPSQTNKSRTYKKIFESLDKRPWYKKLFTELTDEEFTDIENETLKRLENI